MDTTTFDTKRRGETGSALFIAVMMLVLMGFLGLAALERVSSDEQVAGFQNRQRTAFYAAEAGVTDGRLEVKDSAAMLATTRAWHTAAAPQNLGDAALYTSDAHDHATLREIRFSFVTRSRRPDPNLTGATFQVLENRDPIPGTDGFRRRPYSAAVRIRNVGHRWREES